METFQPGDRVVAINTDHSRPICGPANPGLHPFTFPDGRLCKGPIYHVASVSRSRMGNPTLWITGLRVFWGNQEIPWDGTRFRKVDALKDFPKAKRKSQISNSQFDTLQLKTLTDSTQRKSILLR